MSDVEADLKALIDKYKSGSEIEQAVTAMLCVLRAEVVAGDIIRLAKGVVPIYLGRIDKMLSDLEQDKQKIRDSHERV